MTLRQSTTCCVVGGGPAGMMLGLLLARAGVQVTVLEKHGDFLRDFRGDTVHTSTLNLLDELGLGEEFAQLPQRRLEQLQFPMASGIATFANTRRLPGKHPYIALVPQWDLLDLLARAGKAEPSFTLRMNTEVLDTVTEHGRVVGVRYRGPDGTVDELRADLTVAADGRGSVLQAASRLPLRDYPVPMDVWWFRVPREESDPAGLLGQAGPRRAMVMIDRGDYWQCACLIPKGSDDRIRAEGLAAWRASIAELVPWLAERVPAISSWDEVKLLDVRLDRLLRWYRPGLLCIGDAAHAMSPAGGVGINLAVQDAVAAARLLAWPLLRGSVEDRDLARVQRRRTLPTVVIQTMQRVLHARGLTPVLRGEVDLTGAAQPPLPLRLLRRFPALQTIPAYLIAIGPRPEHAPRFARRVGSG